MSLLWCTSEPLSERSPQCNALCRRRLVGTYIWAGTSWSDNPYSKDDTDELGVRPCSTRSYTCTRLRRSTKPFLQGPRYRVDGTPKPKGELIPEKSRNGWARLPGMLSRCLQLKKPNPAPGHQIVLVVGVLTPDPTFTAYTVLMVVYEHGCTFAGCAPMT